MNDGLQEISLFPLRVVLFPGGRLKLQIFERRYIDLVSHCMRHSSGFGICLLKSGDEVVQDSARQTIHRLGTYCHIVDWDQLENGLLGITVEGSVKFKIEDCWQADSGVLQANVLFSAEDRVGGAVVPVGDEHSGLVDLLQNLENHPLVNQQDITVDYDNLREIGWRLAELIPVDVGERQKLLEIDDPRQRLYHIEVLVADLANG